MQKRIGFAVSEKKGFSHSFQSAITHSQSFRGYHSASLLLSPQVSLTVAPFLGAPGGDQSPLLPVGVGSAWGPAQGLICPMAGPGKLVHPSNESSGAQPSGASEHWPEREPIYHQVAHLLICHGLPSLQPSQATSLAAQGFSVVGISLGPPEMLQKPVLKKSSTTLGELESSGLLPRQAQRH